MKDNFLEEQMDLKKLNEAFLYDIGGEYAKIICEETDELVEKYKDLEIPESMDQRFYSLLEELEAKERRAQRQKKVRQISKRAAVILLVITVALSAVTFSVDAFRIKFFNVLLETKEKFGLVFYEEEKNKEKVTAPDDWTGLYPSYIPDDYILLESEVGVGISILRYVNGNGDILELIQGTMVMTSQIDTEGAKVIEVDIKGNSGIIAEKDNVIIIGWSKKEIGFILQGNIDKSTLLEIAEKVIQKK